MSEQPESTPEQSRDARPLRVLLLDDASIDLDPVRAALGEGDDAQLDVVPGIDGVLARIQGDAPDVVLVTTLDALGNATRRRIVRILAPGPRSVGEIAAELPISRPAVSKHLRVLEDAALVAHESQGNRNLFRLHPAGFDAARRWLDAFWDDALSRFVMVAETPQKRQP